MTLIFPKAKASATLFHEGQFRKDKVTPYIVHPEAVAVIAERMVRQVYRDMGMGEAPEAAIDLIKAVAVYHDVWEDQKAKGAGREQTLRDFAEFSRPLVETSLDHVLHGKELAADTLKAFVDAIELLTKPEGEDVSYFGYLVKIKTSGIARLVKLADLEHNLSDLKPGKLRDKYLLAQYFLLK